MSRLAKLYPSEEKRIALDHLMKHNIIVSVAKKPFSYELNPGYRDPNKQSREDFEYVVQLLAAMMAQQKQII